MKIFARIKDYFSNVYLEAKKIIWPSRKEVIRDTLTVVISVAIAMLIFGLIDFFLSIGLERLILQGR